MTMLRDSEGMWVHDTERLKQLVNDFYTSLFSVQENAEGESLDLDCPKIM